MKLVIATIAAVGGLASADPKPAHKPTPLERYLADLPAGLVAAGTPDDLRALIKTAPGTQVDDAKVSDGSLHITLTVAATDARWLASTWKLARPYAMSPDVHQRGWVMELFQEDVPDDYGKRIAVTPITFGTWAIRPVLQGRPAGALPKVSAGASPAYDLARYPAKLVAFEITASDRVPVAPSKAPIDDKAAVLASKQFLDVVAKSRPAIQACYQQALAKDAALGGRTITLRLVAAFSAAGANTKFTSSPSLGDAFDACVSAIGKAWVMTKLPSEFTFKATVSLTP